MKISSTYRFIASLLSISIIAGVTIPAGLHAQSHNMCDSMQTDMHSNHDMPSGMMHAEAHDFGFACACSIEEAPLKTEAPVFKKVKAQVFSVLLVLNEDQDIKPESIKKAIQISGSYSSPPIFLANETFLI